LFQVSDQLLNMDRMDGEIILSEAAV